MGERTSHTPGSFSFAELETSDAAAAQAFYASVFAWQYEAVSVGGDAPPYFPAFRDGRQVAALFESRAPPHWNSYVTVGSAEESAARAAEIGGRIVQDAFDVMTLGRMAAIADPTGATVMCWEPRDHIGAYLVNQPGAMTWNDLVTPDPTAAEQFYPGLFGWDIADVPSAGGYRTIVNDGRMNGGIMPMPDAQPAWIPYFGHEDLDRLLGELDGLGASLVTGPRQMPAGRIAMLSDPQGAVFAVWTGDYED
jgi:predicted enzyme related to lactoylglutathione lyase